MAGNRCTSTNMGYSTATTPQLVAFPRRWPGIGSTFKNSNKYDDYDLNNINIINASTRPKPVNDAITTKTNKSNGPLEGVDVI